MASATTDFSRQERARLVAAAQNLFMERGIGPVTWQEVALALRSTVAAIESSFPAASQRWWLRSPNGIARIFASRKAAGRRQLHKRIGVAGGTKRDLVAALVNRLV